jgi:hypothetical protein
MMKFRNTLISGVFVFLTLLATGPAFSQERVTSGPATGTVVEEDLQWVWGEVVSLDAPNRSIKIKFLDYETDTEKEMTVTVDDKTAYENVKAFEEIKPQDTLSVDYAVSTDGKNLAKNINVEKPEDMQGLTGDETPAVGEGASPATEEAPAVSGSAQESAAGEPNQTPAAGTQQ